MRVGSYVEKTWDDHLNINKVRLIKKYASAYGVSCHSIKSIMEETGMSIEGAAEEALRIKDEKQFYVNGKLFSSFRQSIESLHIGHRNITAISKENGITKSEAVQLYEFLKEYGDKEPKQFLDNYIETNEERFDYFI